MHRAYWYSNVSKFKGIANRKLMCHINVILMGENVALCATDYDHVPIGNKYACAILVLYGA